MLDQVLEKYGGDVAADSGLYEQLAQQVHQRRVCQQCTEQECHFACEDLHHVPSILQSNGMSGDSIAMLLCCGIVRSSGAYKHLSPAMRPACNTKLDDF